MNANPRCEGVERARKMMWSSGLKIYRWMGEDLDTIAEQLVEETEGMVEFEGEGYRGEVRWRWWDGEFVLGLAHATRSRDRELVVRGRWKGDVWVYELESKESDIGFRAVGS